jgi:hypothetical protein
MKYHWPFVATLAFATAPNYALAGPPVLNAVADVSVSALVPPARPLGTTMPILTFPFESGPLETLAQCMAYWDAATHMSKVEWRRACQRTQDGTSS